MKRDVQELKDCLSTAIKAFKSQDPASKHVEVSYHQRNLLPPATLSSGLQSSLRTPFCHGYGALYNFPPMFTPTPLLKFKQPSTSDEQSSFSSSVDDPFEGELSNDYTKP